MRRFLLLSVLLILALGIGLVGCSDDDNGTGPLTAGDPNDPGFQFVREQIGDDVLPDIEPEIDITLALVEEATGIVLGDAPKGGAIRSLASSDDSLTSIVVTSWEFTDENWFVFTFSVEMIEVDNGLFPETTFVNVEGVDSAQFLMGSTTLDTSVVAQGFDGIKVRAHAEVDAHEAADTIQSAIHHRLDLAVQTSGSDSTLFLNGTTRDTLWLDVSDTSGTCDIELTQSQTVTGLVQPVGTNGEGECPSAGVVTLAASIDLDCVGGEGLETLGIEGGWVITVAISDDGLTRTVTYSDGTHLWTIVEDNDDCGSGGQPGK